jgi:hypothetical protein
MLQADVRPEISLPEGLSDVNQLVAVAQQLLRKIGVAVLSQLLLQVQEQQLEAVLGPRWSEQPQREALWECLDCGSNYDFQRRGSRERERLRTGVGDVAFDLLQVTCQRCGKTFSPCAGLLNLERWQQSTTELQAQVVALPLDQGYEKSLQASGNSLMSTVSAMTAHRWVQEQRQQIQIAPSDDLEGATRPFDGTQAKAGDSLRGVAVRLGIAVLGRDEKRGRRFGKGNTVSEAKSRV